jgi:hypothetical protein
MTMYLKKFLQKLFIWVPYNLTRVNLPNKNHSFAFATFEIFFASSDSFKFQKFQTHNTKAMAKDKKFYIAVTYFVL